MRLTTLILITAILQVSASSFAQRITLSEKNAPLVKVFDQIRNQSGFDFMFSSSTLKDAERVSINVKDAELKDVLEMLFKNQPLEYKINEKSVVVSVKTPSFLDRVLAAFSAIDIRGKVVGENDEILIGATVKVKGTDKSVSTDKNGEFYLQNVDETAVVVVSYLGYVSREVKAGKEMGVIKMELQNNDLQEVSISTGYQIIPKERATGSFEFVDNKLINRTVSTNFLDRIENLTTGLLINRGDAAKTDPFLIRGRSTIYANAQPLIVLDNFPYDGDLNNINPNDIENITILKDAAAASIWGARAGNGVIVITTKRGRAGVPRISFSTNMTAEGRPDLSKVRSLNSSDFIELEKDLFSNGFYTSDEESYRHMPLTPVVDLLIAKRDNPLLTAEVDAKIEALKKNDVYKDIRKYLYRNSLNQQHALNISGKQDRVSYYTSAGFDRNLSSLQGTEFDRISLRSINTIKLTDKLDLEAGISYFQTRDKSGNNSGGTAYTSVNGGTYFPYAQLADASGNALPIQTNYRQSWMKGMENSGFLNWDYVPIDEIDNEVHTVRKKDLLLNTALKYNILPNLSAEFKYQYESQIGIGEDLYKENSFYTRNIINKYTMGTSVADFTYPIPKGGILTATNSELNSHQGRGQLNYSLKSGPHELNAIGGFEVRSITTTRTNDIKYGYNEEYVSSTGNLDYKSYFIFRDDSGAGTIPVLTAASKLTDHFISYYGNFSYTNNNRYVLSGSARNDLANLFGVNTNQKGIPLWSAGVAWLINNESFYNVSFLPYLKLRTTYGYNGNISRKTSALTTIRVLGTSNQTNLPVSEIVNPPNETLRWERVKVFNLGLDFGTKNNRITGSLDYFSKVSEDLIAEAPVDPTLGVAGYTNASVFTNVAAMKGNGVEFNVSSKNIDGAFKWQTNYLFSYSPARLKKYLMPVASTASSYLFESRINPIEGRPLYSLYSFQWAGLDPLDGNPQGYLGGQKSTDWTAIYNTLPADSLVFHGAVQPEVYGAFRNTFSYKGFTVSANISYKFNYYFRRTSVQSVNAWTMHSDFAKRWKKSGDEVATDVPSFIYPRNTSRDAFYQYSSALVEKGDHIRLEDVTLNYAFPESLTRRLHMGNLNVFTNISQLGVIWRANKQDIDPYFNNSVINSNRISFGANFTF